MKLESKKLYTTDGWLNVPYIMGLGFTFVSITGGRGTGKTFGFLEYALLHEIKFFYIRRTGAVLEMLNRSNELNPLIPVNSKNGWNFKFSKINKFMLNITDDAENVAGLSAALSTFNNLRSLSFDDIDLVIYDEFVPEKHVKKMAGEGQALMNLLETVGRNRELQGKPPLRYVGLSNADDLANPIYMELGVVNDVEKMLKKGKEMAAIPERDLLLIHLLASPISSAKKTTSLYRLTKGSEFSRMSVENEYSREEFGNIKSQNLREYSPIVTVGEITVYRHKSRKRLYYVSTHQLGSPEVFSAGETDLKRFRKKYHWVWGAYLSNHIIFENYLTQVLLERYHV